MEINSKKLTAKNSRARLPMSDALIISALVFCCLHSPCIFRAAQADETSKKPVTFAFTDYWNKIQSKFQQQLISSGAQWVNVRTSWCQIQPGGVGPYNWSPANSDLDALINNGALNIAPRIGSCTKYGSFGKVDDDDFKITDEAAWINFIKAMVDRYKDKVKVWVLEIEPDYEFVKTGEEWNKAAVNYAHLLAITYPALKEADPEAQLAVDLTIATHVNPDPNIYKGIDALLELGAGNSFDILGLDYYGGIELIDGKYDWVWTWPSPIKFTDYIATLKTRLNNYGYTDKPIWIFESGASSGSPDDPASPPYADRVMTQGENIVKMHVMAFAQGIEQMHWIMFADGEWGYWDPASATGMTGQVGIRCRDGCPSCEAEPGKRCIQYGQRYVICEPRVSWVCAGLFCGEVVGQHKYEQKSSYIVYQKLTSVLAGSDFVSKEVKENKFELYRFEKTHKIIVAVWNNQDDQESTSLEVGSSEYILKAEIINAITTETQNIPLGENRNTITLAVDISKNEPKYIVLTTAKALGDVSDDGQVTAFDAALAAKIAVDLPDVNIKHPQAADFDGNGLVDAYDAALIARWAVGL